MEKDAANPFAIPSFWKSSAWLEQTIFDINSRSPLFSLDVSQAPQALIAGDGPLVLAEVDLDVAANAGFFSLPPVLKEFADQKARPKPDGDEPMGDSHVESEILRISDDDLWVGHDHTIRNSPKLKTWDGFSQEDHRSSAASSITEAGPEAFDALIDSEEATPHARSDVVDSAAYAACLLNLAMGRSSLLFAWDAEKKSFVKTAPRLRISGLSLQSIGGIDELCVESANATKQLLSFAENTYSVASTPTRVALAGAIDKLVLAVQSELSFRSHSTASILQLQAAARPAHMVLTYFRSLVEKLAKQKSDEGILSCLFQEAQSAAYRSDLLQEIAREVLRLVSKPWTDFVEEWAGLKAEEGISITKTGPGKSFVKVADKVWIDDMGYELEEADFFLDEDKIPSFMPEDIARTAFEAGRNLRFLREHHPDHPLSQQYTISQAKPPSLEWQFDWKAMTQLESKVNAYKDALTCVLRNRLTGSESALPSPETENTYELKFFGQGNAHIAATVLASINQLNQPPRGHHATNGFTKLLRERLYPDSGLLDNGALSPHWSLVPLLSFGPVINVQSRLINQECMKVLFSAHHLRMHIDLLKQYYLLSNGLLCSRLSHALFDPELETTERQAGVALGGGIMGLRLGGRENWPPASSELRLALMGVLTESYQPPPGLSQKGQRVMPSRSFSSDLPGELSFAVRDLSPEEIDRCMDPDSLEALDFLRLSYKAPSPLQPIMTPTILVKYDRIFMCLLRVQRMLYVVNQLFHDVPLAGRRHGDPSDASLRFCVEARHFVRQIAAYFLDSGVTAPWHRFEAWLDLVEAGTLGEGNVGQEKDNGKNYSPDVLRDRQERMLDEMTTTLLLRKRQQPVLKLLQEAFTVILRFARQLRLRDTVVGENTKVETPEKLYATFRKKVEVFLTVCRGLTEKAVTGSKGTQARGQGVENTIGHLLFMMDMSGFYARKPSG